MPGSLRQIDFLEFRKRYPVFLFEKQDYTITKDTLSIVYTFRMGQDTVFRPRLEIPLKPFFLPPDRYQPALDNLVFHLGMIELISYWKAACPPLLIIKPFLLDRNQVAWWKKLYYLGLGEFFYLNHLETRIDDFLEIVSEGASPPPTAPFGGGDGLMIPVGGGKDSIVTLELLGSRPDTVPLIVNPRGATLATVETYGFDRARVVEIKRTIDPALLALNDQGFLNGHTPFSAMLGFVSVLAAFLTGRRNIALSNEASAEEATVRGTEVNHQYSKSLAFESDFRDYVARYINPEINYFSFLRPLGELQIASLFARFPKYFSVFRSCNAGSKSDTWCGACAKCLFTAIILSPFLSADRIAAIFGKNLFDDETLLPIFEELTGTTPVKPFECVGTVDEVNVALCETVRNYSGELPFLLSGFKRSRLYETYSGLPFPDLRRDPVMPHFLGSEFLAILDRHADVQTGQP